MSEKQVENFAKFSNVLDAKKYEKALTLFEKKKGLGLTPDEYTLMKTAMDAIFASFGNKSGGNSGGQTAKKPSGSWKGKKK